jgi:predicted metal-binding protein
MTKPVTLFVCTSCRRAVEGHAEAFDHPGQAIAVALSARFADTRAITVEPVECLAVCKRPATIALSGEGRWMYLIGDLDPALHIDDIVSAARAYAATDNGIVPWRERPPTFRKGVVARIPPLGFKQSVPAA